MNVMKKLIAAVLFGAFAFALNAQPDATVDQDGNLVLNPGTAEEQVIPKPEGEVVNGDLVVGGTTIPAPDATLLADGSLELGDGTILTVPDLPGGGDFIISWFGSDLLDYDDQRPASEDQWYFSWTYKNIYHFAASNWFTFQELQATVFLDPNSGGRNLDDGIWGYTQNLFPGQTEGTWMYLARKFRFNDLRDSDGDGTLDLSNSEGRNATLSGSIYILTPSGYDTEGPGWFAFSEFAGGNFIGRIGGAAGLVKLTDPIGP